MREEIKNIDIRVPGRRPGEDRFGPGILPGVMSGRCTLPVRNLVYVHINCKEQSIGACHVRI